MIGSLLKAGFGSPFRASMSVGAIYGASQGYDLQSMVEGGLKGAAVGAMGGAALKMAPAALKATPAIGLMAGKQALGMGKNFLTGRGMSGLVGRAAWGAVNHPLGVGMAVGGAYLGAKAYGSLQEYRGKAQSMDSPYQEGIRSNISYDQQAAMFQEMGQIGGGTIGPPSMMQGHFDYANMVAETGMTVLGKTRTGRMLDSTIGLPQGLHRGRHG